MKTFTRWLLAFLLVATPMLVAIPYASANTELVPASRLVAPYVDITTGRATFLLLTNVTAVEMTNTTSGTAGIHLEFYDKTCARSSTIIELSAKDIDQLNVSTSNFTGTSKVGFVDIDVRDKTVYTDPFLAKGIRANALLGEVVITDSSSDFALSYPMAASLGSTGSGAGGTIVTRSSGGAASGWFGRYEAFPNRLYVPGFYAEGGSGAGAILSSLLAVVSPADGNWHGNGTSAGASAEAPGENLTANSISTIAPNRTLVTLQAVLWDGCERSANKPVSGHTIMASLGSSDLFSTLVDRTTWLAANCTGTPHIFPGTDELSGAPVGWIDLPNTSKALKGGDGTYKRGIVGVLFESTNVTASTKGGDVARLWGDPDSTHDESSCKASSVGGGPSVSVSPCPYSLVDTQSDMIP